MLLLRAYFDESGHAKDPNLHFTGMAGFVAPTQVWHKVEERWKAVTVSPQYGLRRPFHMREFVHKDLGQFKGWEQERKDSLYRSLIQILVEFEVIPTGCIVSSAAFRSLNAQQQVALRSPYYVALHECIRGACSQALALEPETVDMVFAMQSEYGTLSPQGENNADNSGTTERLFYGIKRHVPELGRYMGVYGSGEPKTTIPLQAADMLAYEMTKEYENLLGTQRLIRKSYQALMRYGGRRPLVKFFDRLALLRILRESGFPDEEGFEELDDDNISQIVARHTAQNILDQRREPGAFSDSCPKWLADELERRWPT